MKKILLLLLTGCLSFFAQAQLSTPAPSPLCQVTQQVGLTKFTVEYSRPSIKGRTIFGDLVPYGKMWRTGANKSTKISFDKDITMAGHDIPAGEYALYTIPGEKEWTIIIHRNTTHSGTGGSDYDQSEDQVRFTVEPISMGDIQVETFLILFNNIRNNSVDIELLWESTNVIIPITLNTTTQVENEINEIMAGPSGMTYYRAARFYHDEKIHTDQALEWIDKALEMEGNKFWMLRVKSEIQADLGDYKGAIKTANLSREAAAKAGNDDYIKINKNNIAKWSSKKK